MDNNIEDDITWFKIIQIVGGFLLLLFGSFSIVYYTVLIVGTMWLGEWNHWTGDIAILLGFVGMYLALDWMAYARKKNKADGNG